MVFMSLKKFALKRFGLAKWVGVGVAGGGGGSGEAMAGSHVEGTAK